MYHYYACIAYLAVKFYQYSGVLDTTLKICKDVGSVYSWIGWALTRSPVLEIEDDRKYMDWVLILEDEDVP